MRVKRAEKKIYKKYYAARKSKNTNIVINNVWALGLLRVNFPMWPCEKKKLIFLFRLQLFAPKLPCSICGLNYAVWISMKSIKRWKWEIKANVPKMNINQTHLIIFLKYTLFFCEKPFSSLHNGLAVLIACINQVTSSKFSCFFRRENEIL